MSSTGVVAAYVDTCQLLDSFGKFVQVVCGLLAASVLVVKRYRERPRRVWKVRPDRPLLVFSVRDELLFSARRSGEWMCRSRLSLDSEASSCCPRIAQH